VAAGSTPTACRSLRGGATGPPKVDRSPRSIVRTDGVRPRVTRIPAAARVKLDDNAGRLAAVRLLLAGELVGLPTDTVYGLAAAARLDSIERLFMAKGRPAERGIVLLLAAPAEASELGKITDAAAALAGAFWPGPLTLVLDQRPDVSLPEVLTGGRRTIGLRVPNHPCPRWIAREIGPLPTTSANRTGGPPARTATEVMGFLGDAVALVLDGGPTPHGASSTVVDCTAPRPTVLREGALGAADLAAVLDLAGIGHAFR